MFLFMLYSRSRTSDVRNVTSVWFDVVDGHGYLEVKTQDHKMRRLTGRLGLSLNLVAPIHGLCKESWALAFKRAAQNVGFDFDGKFTGPLLPGITASGEWTRRAVGSDEVTKWSNMLLERLLKTTIAPGFTSHGFKATTLSWLAKAGYSEDSRLILGHHSLKNKRTLETYSRDMMSQPLRELDACLKTIRVGAFLPDQTRSGYFSSSGGLSEEMKQPAFLEKRQQSNVLEPPAKSEAFSDWSQVPEGDAGNDSLGDRLMEFLEEDSAGSTSSESSDSSCTDADVEDACDGFVHVETIDEWRPDCDVFQNPKTKTLRLRAKGSALHTYVCGRAVNPEAKLFTGRHVFSHEWKCKQCDNSKPLRDVDAVVAHLDKTLKKRKGL